jgi:hypothetical protein
MTVQRMRLFRQPNLTGFNLVRAFNENQDAAFHAIQGTSAACIATADRIGRYGHRVLYVPILVVDAPLLQCHLPAGTKEYLLNEVKEGVLVYNPGTEWRPDRLTIHIIHIDALRSFLETVKWEGRELFRLIRPLIIEEAAREK